MVLRYLKELAGHFGKVAIIMDNAPQHKAKTVSEFLKGQQERQGSLASNRNAGAQRHGGVLAPVKARRAGVRVLWNNRADAPRNVRAFQDGAAVA